MESGIKIGSLIPVAMPPDLSQISAIRPRTLTTLPAEWVETRGQEALGLPPPYDEGPILNPQKKTFVSVQNKAVVSVQETSLVSVQEKAVLEYNFSGTEAKERVAALRTKLAAFSDKIHSLDPKLAIKQKEPDEYTLSDVLEIAEQVKSSHCKADKKRTFAGAIRKCFRLAQSKLSLCKAVLEFAPTDMYGCVITGGLTLLLGAMESAQHVNEELYAAVDGIPTTLEDVYDVLEVNRRAPPQICERAEAVFIAIVDILVLVVDELCKNMGRKGLKLILEGSQYRAKADKVVAALDEAIAEFKTKADNNDRRKIEETNCTVGIVRAGVDGLAVSMHEMNVLAAQSNYTVRGIETATHQWAHHTSEGFAGIHTRLDEMEVQRQERQQVAADRTSKVLNAALGLMESSDLLDKSGNMRDLEQVFQERRYENSRRRMEWMKYLGSGVDSLASKDRDDCLQRFELLAISQKRQVHFILRSEKLAAWLKNPLPDLLVIRTEPRSTNPTTASSFTSAMLLSALEQSDDQPALAFFAGLRTNEFSRGPTARPDGMLALLFAQVLAAVRDQKVMTVRLVQLGKPLRSDDEQQPTERLDALEEKLHRLFLILPECHTITIILDSVMQLHGKDEDVDRALRCVLDIPARIATAGRKGPVVKILVTDLPHPRLVEEREHVELYVPADADGAVELNPAFTNGETIRAIREMHGDQAKPADAGRELGVSAERSRDWNRDRRDRGRKWSRDKGSETSGESEDGDGTQSSDGSETGGRSRSREKSGRRRRAER